MHNKINKSIAIYVILWLITVIVTFTAAYLLVDEASKSPKFYLSLYALIFAETLSFLLPVYLIQTGAIRRKKFPYHVGQATIIGLYDVGVFSLVMVALSSISYELLLVLHLVLFLICVICLGLSVVGSFAFSKTDARIEKQRQPFRDFRNEFALVCDRMEILQLDEAQTLVRSLKTFNDEELEYATTESLPGSEDVDMEMSFCLQKIRDKIMNLEQNANQSDVSEKSDPSHRVLLQEINHELDRMKIHLKRREQIIGQ
jgi:hypothetical protein